MENNFKQSINNETYEKFKNIKGRSNSRKNNFKKIFDLRNNVVFLSIVLILVIISIVILVFNLTKTKEIEQKKISYVTNEPLNTNVVERIRNSGEHERMKVYIGEIIKAIEEKRYDFAYIRMNEEYRNKYFPSLNSFKQYCETVLPKNMAVSHNNIERIGEYYVLEVDLINSSNITDKKNRKNMYFVFKEYNFTDYHFSFSKE